MEEENKKYTIKSSMSKLYQDFGDTTTMHGIGRALMSRSRWRRIIWLLLVLCSATLLVYQLVKMVGKYNSYPVATELSLKHEPLMKFPAVTICNMNRMRSSRLSEEFKEIIRDMQLIEGLRFLRIVNALIRTQDEKTRLQATHKMSDMLVDCFYKRDSCSEDNFTQEMPDVYGMCHTFHVSDNKNIYITKAGPQNGLVLELDSEHRDYLSLSLEAGFIILVHDEREVPFPEEGGVLAQPGAVTNIGIKKAETHRLPAPYGSCVPADSSLGAQISLYTDYQYKYTENACRKSCNQIHLYDRCGCCFEEYPCQEERIAEILGLKLEDVGLIRYCNFTEPKDLTCYLIVEDLYMEGNLNCSEQCPPACDQTTYEMTVSTALWPSDQYLDVFMEKVNKTILENLTLESTVATKQLIRYNFLKVQIYFETLDFSEVVTKPMYDWTMLLADIGGQLGLCLGFSIMTALELVELVMDMFVVCIRRFTGK